MSITVKAIGLRHGYSRVDHCITGTECADLIGRSFASRAHLARAANALARRNVQHRDLRLVPIWVEIIHRDDSTSDIKV